MFMSVTQTILIYIQSIGIGITDYNWIGFKTVADNLNKISCV